MHLPLHREVGYDHSTVFSDSIRNALLSPCCAVKQTLSIQTNGKIKHPLSQCRFFPHKTDLLRSEFPDPVNISIHPTLQKLPTGNTNIAGIIDQTVFELNKCLGLSHGGNVQIG